jgi:hypothetical protein
LGGVRLAGEVSLIRERAFAVVHAVVEAAGTWNVAVFQAPSPGGFSAGVAAPGDELRRQCGGALHRTSLWKGMATRLTVYGSARRIGGSVLRRSRIEGSLRGRAGDGFGRWSVAARLSRETHTEPSDDAISHRPSIQVRRQAQLRGAWSGGGSGVFRQRYRLSLRLDERGTAAVTGTVGWIVAIRVCEASCQVSNYDVSNGRTGFVILPGTAGPEAVSAVSRSGTDVSARIRVRLGNLRLGLYWDRRWGKPPRWYVRAGVRL